MQSKGLAERLGLRNITASNGPSASSTMRLHIGVQAQVMVLGHLAGNLSTGLKVER